MSDPSSPIMRRQSDARAEHGRRKRQRTRQRLLEAAFDLLGRQDGAHVQIEEVVAHAGASRGTFYNYFDSRDDLLNVMASELNHGLDVALSHAPDPVARTALAVRAYLNKATQDPRWGWAMVNVSMNVRTIFGQETHSFATETLRDGIDGGYFPLPTVQAGLDLVLGTTFHAVRAICEARSAAGHPEDVTRLVLFGLGVTPTRVEQLLDIPLPALDIADGLTQARGSAVHA